MNCIKFLLPCAALLAAGCGEIIPANVDSDITGDASGDGDSDKADASVDPEALLGVWVFRNPEGEVATRFRLLSDGTFTTDSISAGTSSSGTYELLTAPNRLVVDGVGDDTGERIRWATTYYVAGDWLFINPYLPVGLTEGVIGTWVSVLVYESFNQIGEVDDSVGGTTTLTLRNNGTGLIVTDHASDQSDTSVEGTWDFDVGQQEYEFTYPFNDAGDTITISFDFVDSQILGTGTAYEREE